MMTDPLIALISIFVGLISSNIFAYYYKPISLGFTANTIAGVFGSILFIKVFGRLGFGPKVIMQTGDVNATLFAVNMFVSCVGGVFGLYLAKTFKAKMDEAD